MKMYSALKPMIVYNQNGLLLPKGEKPGYGNAVILLSPTKDLGYQCLTNGFLEYKRGLYKNYIIDFVYKEKIGFKKYLKNNTGVFKKEFNEKEFPAHLRLVTNGNRVSVLKRNSNLIINLGEWNDIYFQYQIKNSLEKICKNYFSFIGNKINNDDYSQYNKIIYIDMDQWFSTTNKLAFDRRNLTNPISIMLVALYKFPEAFSVIGKCDIVLVSRSANKVLKLTPNDLIKKNYQKVKQRVISILRKEVIDESMINEEIVIDNKKPQKSIDKMSDEEVLHTLNESKSDKEMIRNKIISELTKNLVGDTDDITKEFEEDDDSEIITDDEKINELKNFSIKYLDDHPELLDTDDITVALDEVQNEVKKKFYVQSYTPKYTDQQLENIKKLTDIQNDTIGNLDISIRDMESKIIDESDYSSVVTSNNPNIIQSKFVNFDKSYNQKKLQKDIDNVVGQMAYAKTKVFVTDKKEEDTSTSLDLKKTLTYKLEDENGNKMTMKFDVPIIFDDHYMMIKGNKKIIQHMLVLKPIVKTGKDTVQIATNYKKMFVDRKGITDVKTTSLFKYINANKEAFSVINGNGIVTNKTFKSTLEYNVFAKNIVQFKIDSNLFILDPNQLVESLDKMNIKYQKIDLNKNVLIGVDLDKKKPITISIDDSFTDKILSYLSNDDIESIKSTAIKTAGSRNLMYTRTKILHKYVPLILLLLYFEGFEEVMRKANIEYEVIQKDDTTSLNNFDFFNWGLIELEDAYIKWKRYPSENSLLLNGLSNTPLNSISIDELQNKEIFMYLLTSHYNYANQSFNLDNFYDFMIDPISKEILTDMNLPTDLVSLLILANKMLKSDEASAESDMSNMRLRSNEIIAYHAYQAMVEAYSDYRKTQHKKTPNPISVRRDAIIKKLNDQPASAMNEGSILNPVLEISKLRAVTYKGEGGINKDHAFSLPIRAYNDSMLGVLGITTSPDSGVGINRQLSLEPNITSTRGYIDVAGKENVEELTSANLLSPAELLTPLGVQHDDPTRTSMAYKQSLAMVLVDESDPVLIGNGAEKILPYHLSSEFTIVAEDDGVVVDKKEDYVVIQYDNGKYRSIDTSLKIKKNSSAGFYIESQLTCNKNIGDRVSKNEVVAWDNKAFAKEGTNKDVAMRLGPLIKIAIVPEWDIYEDSAPITHAASEKMTTTMVMPVEVTLKKEAYVSKMLQIGDKVNAGESVIVFNDYHEDETIMNALRILREDQQEDLIENNLSTKKSHYTGTIVDIDVITTVPLDELSDSLRDIVSAYWKRLKKREKVLDKYKNSDDLKYYKSGNVISSTTSPVKPDMQGKVKGRKVDDGVIITFYVSFKDIMSRGDKLASEFALKSINSHVIDKGLEPYSEFHPDETIDLISAPLSISARKTPSIFLAMFGNKLLIEAKRHLKEYWNSN